MRRKHNVHDKEYVSPCALLRAVLAPACQRLWRVGYNDAYRNSRVFALLLTLAPDRPDVSSRTLSSRLVYPLVAEATLSECFRRFVTSPP